MIIKQMRGLAEISGLNIDHVDVELAELVTNGRAQALDGVLAGTVHRQTCSQVKKFALSQMVFGTGVG